MKTVLVPVDFSPVTKAVLDAATTIASAVGAKIFLVHVAPVFVPDLKNVRVPQHERDFVAHKLREEHRDLQGLSEDLAKRGCDVEALMVEGHGTVEKILDEATRLDADLIVAGSHGHGRLYDMIVGSVSEGILRKAKVPVLVVPAKSD
ncbi:MAG: universal stress protein [Phycisphaerales bacterium]|nr:universal stress protein [Phycisphaerales bacterium]NNM27249.1 universal stress protein [Phycisphaerales bacterium]